MQFVTRFVLAAASVGAALASAAAMAAPPTVTPAQQVDLKDRLAAGQLRVVNREATALDGRNGVHLSERPGPGLAWVEGSDFATGTIEVEVRGRDVDSRSFLGVAFHGADEKTYEGVYLRPFNFRSADVSRRSHAVQYIAPPEWDWQPLRQRFPGEFEGGVDGSVSPTDWVPLRIVVEAARVRVFVASANTPTLDVRRLGQHDRGKVALWTGNNSDGDFANLRITPGK